MRRFTLTTLCVAALSLLAQPAGTAHAQPSAPRDTTWIGALLRHGWIEGGAGWLAAPAHMRRRFEAGQGIAAGLEVRPFAPLRFRLGSDYQILLANGEARYEPLPGKGPFVSDTLEFDIQSRAWSLGLRVEAGWRAPGGVWLMAGGSRDYFDGGIDAYRGLAPDDMLLLLPEAARDGWGWAFTLGAARSLQSILPWPIGLDVHWRSLHRGDEDLRMVSIRIGSMRP